MNLNHRKEAEAFLLCLISLPSDPQPLLQVSSVLGSQSAPPSIGSIALSLARHLICACPVVLCVQRAVSDFQSVAHIEGDEYLLETKKLLPASWIEAEECLYLHFKGHVLLPLMTASLCVCKAGDHPMFAGMVLP